MSAIEQTIIERLQKLDDSQKAQVLEFIEQIDVYPANLSLAEWLNTARASRAAMRAKYGEDYHVDVQSLLDEVREERLDDLMGGG